jgi:hypothetical protein
VNSHTIARIEQLYPLLKVKAYQLIQQQAQQGIDVEVSQGLRTWTQQQVLWQEGRNPDGSYIDPVHQTGVVTHAKPGDSFHEYGLAFDVFPVINGEPCWDVSNPAWSAIISAGEVLGLFSGSRWIGKEKDNPHFQLTGPYGETPDDETKATFAGGGMQAVWEEVDKFYAGVQAELVASKKQVDPASAT